MALDGQQESGSAKRDAGLSPMDEGLLRAARQGDESAFHALVDRHAGRLFRLAVSLVGNEADAEDVLQETLMGAFERMHGFEGRSTVKTWLTRILVRQAARFHRRRGRRKEQMLAPNGFEARVPSASQAADRRLDVREALGRLSREHREVVVLREFDGMSYAEMADTLGVPQGTVESRLYRARQELKGALRGYLS